MLSFVDESIERYAESHSSRTGELLEELAETTRSRMAASGMLSGPAVGNLLQLLVYGVGAERVLEIGTFTGYSALMMAAALPPDGELITCDVDEEATSIAKSFWNRSHDGPKIRLRLGPALDTLRELKGRFDLIFIDADKERYPEYYDAALPLLDTRGIMVFDNVLWSGRVLHPESESDLAIAALNERVQDDPRVQNVMLTVRDGLLLLRKVSD